MTGDDGSGWGSRELAEKHQRTETRCWRCCVLMPAGEGRVMIYVSARGHDEYGVYCSPCRSVSSGSRLRAT